MSCVSQNILLLLLSLVSSTSGCFFRLPSPSLTFATESLRRGRREASNRTSRKMSSSSSKDNDASTSYALDDVEAYNEIVSSSVDLSNAYITPPAPNLLSVVRTVRDIDCKTKRKFLYTIQIPSLINERSERESGGNNPFLPPVEISDTIKARIPSPSNDKMAILKEETIESGGDTKTTRQVIEIWINNCQCLMARYVINSDSNKVHGKICNDADWFGQLTWNTQETAIVYSAERTIPKTKSFFDTDSRKNVDNSPVNAAQHSFGTQYTLGIGKQESWGEKYQNMVPILDLFILNIQTGKIGEVSNIPGARKEKSDNTNGGHVLGQPVFSPCGNYVVYTKWDGGGDFDKNKSEMPRRLGMIYCFQRPCKLYASPIHNLMERLSIVKAESPSPDKEAEADAECVCLTPNNKLSRSPRFSSTTTNSKNCELVFLTCKNGHDTHGGSVALGLLDWKIDNNGKLEKKSYHHYREVVKTVDIPSTEEDEPKVAGMSFPGLYLSQLPKQCFLPTNSQTKKEEDVTSDSYILATSQWGSIQKVVRICLTNSNGTIVSPLNLRIIDKSKHASTSAGHPKKTKQYASQSLLCITKDGGALIAESTPNQPAVIAYVQAKDLAKATLSGRIDATLVSTMSPLAATSFSSITEPGSINNNDITFDVLTVQSPHIEGVLDTPIQSILLLPKKIKGDDNSKTEIDKPPLIVVPHGGPHSCTATSFIPSYLFLANAGYAVLHVNYRGSTGFGEGHLNALPGKIGLVDVNDVVHSTKAVCGLGLVDPSRIGICGGSHGGFLSGHCIGQYPEIFKAAAMRNPVTNIASMVTSSDIPDWCYVEAFGCGYYNFSKYRGPNKDELEIMWESSPITHIHNVKAPTLIALGMSDLRVPPSQGLEYFYTLRSRGLQTKLLVYEKDDHAIDNVVSEADHWINIKRWFDSHLK